MQYCIITFTLLFQCCSKEGFNEDELLSLLQVPRAGEYTSFKHAIASFIQPIKGCLRYLHSYADRAAHKKYLNSQVWKKKYLLVFNGFMRC